MLRISIKDFKALQHTETMDLGRTCRFLYELSVYWGGLVCYLKKNRMLQHFLILKFIRCYACRYLLSHAQNFNTIFMNLFILDQQSFQGKMTARGE